MSLFGIGEKKEEEKKENEPKIIKDSKQEEIKKEPEITPEKNAVEEKVDESTSELIDTRNKKLAELEEIDRQALDIINKEKDKNKEDEAKLPTLEAQIKEIKDGISQRNIEINKLEIAIGKSEDAKLNNKEEQITKSDAEKFIAEK